MARTYILLVWIELLKGSFIEAGIPLISHSYSSWPCIRSYSKSVASPFLTATPCLSVFPNLSIAPIIPSPDVGFVPKSDEITQKTSVILHKVHKNSENEITLTLKLVKEDDNDTTKENFKCNDKSLDENISHNVIQDEPLITYPVDDEIETENERGRVDSPRESTLMNEDTPADDNTINENRSTDGDKDDTDIFTDEYE